MGFFTCAGIAAVFVLLLALSGAWIFAAFLTFPKYTVGGAENKRSHKAILFLAGMFLIWCWYMLATNAPITIIIQ